MRKVIITIKAHDWAVPARPSAMFTVCKGTFPLHKVIGYATTEANAELIARALVKHYVTAELVRVQGPPEED